MVNDIGIRLTAKLSDDIWNFCKSSVLVIQTKHLVRFEDLAETDSKSICSRIGGSA